MGKGISIAIRICSLLLLVTIYAFVLFKEPYCNEFTTAFLLFIELPLLAILLVIVHALHYLYKKNLYLIFSFFLIVIVVYELIWYIRVSSNCW